MVTVTDLDEGETLDLNVDYLVAIRWVTGNRAKILLAIGEPFFVSGDDARKIIRELQGDEY